MRETTRIRPPTEYNIRNRVNYKTNLNRSIGNNAKAAIPPPSKTLTPPTKTPVSQDGHQPRHGIGMLSKQIVLDHLLGPKKRSPQVSSKGKAKREVETEFQSKQTTKQNKPKSNKRGRSERTKSTVHVDIVDVSNSHSNDKKMQRKYLSCPKRSLYNHNSQFTVNTTLPPTSNKENGIGMNPT